MEELNNLISDCCAGKREAQSKLYRMFAPKLYGSCLRYSHDVAEAEDLLHEGFVIIFSKIGQYAYKGAFEGWMKRIVVNLAMERFRARNKLFTVEDIAVFESKQVCDEIYGNINAQQILEFVQALPPRYRMAFNLYAIDGYSHKEIAEMMGITEGTSKSNVNRARKILQEKVEQMGIKKESYAR